MKSSDFSVKKISPNLGGERGVRNPNDQTSSHDLVEQMEFLYVQVIQVINNSVVNPIPKTCIPIVEITLGNHKSSTNGLPIGPNTDWNQVFAFDKTKDDVLSVTLTLKDEDQSVNSTVIGKREFKLASDIPSRVPPDARIVPQCYSMQEDTETGYPAMLLMSVWFGTQADEVYSQAWFPDASASRVFNTQPKVYLAPKLCYVRVTNVSGHDLISNDGKEIHSVYVKATLGEQVLETGASSGSNPFWNQKLVFAASEPLDDTVLYISLINRLDGKQEECIGKLEKKLSEIKVPGRVSVYDIEPAVEGDSRRFSSKISMKVETDQAYHILDECSQHSSAPGQVGKLEIGILGATGLETMKTSSNAYVVAKYGNKWIRTRTAAADSYSPKWNEQYSWDVYDKRTFVTLGIYDKDVPIGKVRISLRSLESDKLYTRSFPMILDSEEARGGLEKTGELHLAIRYVSFTKPVALTTSLFYRTLLFPKARNVSKLSPDKTEKLKEEAVKLNCMNLANREFPLGNEVVKDMLKPENPRLASMRRSKANYEFLCRMVEKLFTWFAWFNTNIRHTTDMSSKMAAAAICVLLLIFPKWIMFPVVCYIVCKFFSKMIQREFGIGIDDTPRRRLNLDEDLNVEDLESVTDKVVTFLGDERLYVLIKVCDDPVASIRLWTIVYFIMLVGCIVPVHFWGLCLICYLVNFPLCHNNLPGDIFDFLRRLTTEED